MSHKRRRQRSFQQRPIHAAVAKAAKQVDGLSFFNLLTSPTLLQVVEQLLPEYRQRRYPPTVTLAMFLGQVLSAQGSCQQAVSTATIHQLLMSGQAQGVSTGSYCEARARLPLELVCQLTRAVGALLCQHTPTQWLWEGRHIKLVDGTTVLMADTPANQAVYPQHGQQQAGVGFPMARLVAVMSLASGAVLDVCMGPYKGKATGEHALLRQLLHCFEAGDVMVGDSYYASYFLVAELLGKGVDFVFEQHGARQTDFRSGRRLGPGDHVVTWTRPAKPDWMSAEQYEGMAARIQVREVKVGKKVLVSSFVKPRQVSKQRLGALFAYRWNVELDLRNVKTTLGMAQLRCKTPQMCHKELWVYLLAYNLIRLLMAQAALQAGTLPRLLSFKHTVQAWLAWSARQFGELNQEDLNALFTVIAAVRVGRRPGRIEPRAVKQRPKPFPRLHTSRQQARKNIRLYGRPRRARA